MSKYEGRKAIANISQESAFDKISDVKAIQSRLDSLPEDKRAQLQGISFEENAVKISSPMGELKFVAKECVRPERVAFEAEGAPIPITVAINLNAESATTTGLSVVIEADLPFFLKAMVGGKLQDAVDKMSIGFAEAISEHPQQ
ncbi:MAG: hypothetical protein J6Y87_03230 [Muribaculaceae bacterium]|nr:hypothetical protein [Muribaculaceae bacterium]MBR5440972.1 hypothetical protein [Prevotella sp.]MBP5314864.1 hypothetical protein [Muribaculaceae bacterium]MBR4723022.1 hypothetical protein [Muribaculaceae bacterium]MBR5435509.1 hypothetical protein [Muribaculaceae bacterium]